ncbi:competence protein CoiA [Pseudarthrobacter sp. BIM B-2242]|uniref:competence protein CoiA n=1 Tax=Pseudarthrobacter sp. BIM B-2242 TaxID=2772401 RepID=UPI001CC77F2F|nr:competence protein CoiA family protein [Pseudarthrobacter sp. BIM B-2242]
MLDGQRVDAVLSSDDEWFELKKTYKVRSLLTSCGLPAFPRTSSHGLRHFVHKADAKCSVAECWSETPQHRAGKAIVARSVGDAGWVATIEHQADDKSWTADVLAEKDGRRIALEIQWSKQGSPEFAARQGRYERAGVECFWLVHRRNKASAAEADVPHLVFEGDQLPLDVLAHRAFQDDKTTSLADVTALILTGGFQKRAETKATAVTLEYLKMECFACKRDSTVWRIASLDVRTRCQQVAHFETDSYGAAWPLERLETGIYEDMINAFQGTAPLSPLRMHYSKTTKSSYLAYGCGHCERGFFGDFFIMGRHDWEEVALPVRRRIPLSERLLQDAHICEDQGFGLCSQQPRKHSGPVFSGYISSRPDADKDTGEGGDFSLQIVGQDMSIREAALRLAGLWHPSPTALRVKPTGSESSTSDAGVAQITGKKHDVARDIAPGDCDLCGLGNHPEHTCLWRRYRSLTRVPVGRHHFSDDLHARIMDGVLDEVEGTELLRRMYERVSANKLAYGNIGSVAELIAQSDSYWERMERI